MLKDFKRELKSIMDLNDSILEEIFWDPDLQNNAHNTNSRIYYKEIKQIVDALAYKNSVIVYCDRMLSKKIGKCVQMNIEKQTPPLKCH